MKTRWSSPGGIIFQPDSMPQTLIDSRAPKTRLAFTETLPIELFIDTCNVDWVAMRRRDKKIKKILDECNVIRVCGRGTCFDALLKKKDKRRWVRCDDGMVNRKINEEFFRMTGAKAWMMGNLPGGEVFVTPESVVGKIVGDVVINIDQSYVLNRRSPLVINIVDNKYDIVGGPKKIIHLIKEKKREVWKALNIQEKYKSLPREIIKIKKANFNRIGELGINTNPKARLSNYLIVNEKIANMIHVALGAGFEPDRNTEYHYDVVIDAKGQKLDVYGMKRKEKKWILKKGKFVV
jgi:leucyl aminopeptidase (aminopeptidase T)